MIFHTYNPLSNVPTKTQFPRPYGYQDIARTKFYRSRSKVKSRSHHDVTHLQHTTNVPTKYELPTPYCTQDIAQTRFYRSRSLGQGQIKVTPRCCTPTPPNQCPYQASTSYPLQFQEIAQTKLYRSRSL